MNIPILFNGPAYESDSTFMSGQVCCNFYLRPYPEIDPATGTGAFALFGTPGFKEWVDLGVEVEIRGTLVFGGEIYVVGGNKLYRITAAGVKVQLGIIGSSTGPLGMATNNLDLVIVDGVGGHIWDYATATFGPIVDPDFPVGSSIVQIDGYYLVPKDGTGQVWRSDWNNGASWGGLAFSTAGSDPDLVVALAVSNRDVYVIGEKTTEIWVNAGTTPFNFVPVSGAFISKGGVGPYAVGVGNNAIFWVGKDDRGQGQLIRSIGRSPKVVSTPAIVREIQSWGDLSDLQILVYEQLDQTHIVITSPSADKTLVYDSTVGQWHERSSRIAGVDSRWRINTHSLFDNKHIVGDYTNGKLYELKTDLYDEDGEEMVSVRRTPVLRSKQNRITVDSVQVVTEPGVGLATGEDQDVDPQAMFRWSRDGGRNWSAISNMSLGKIGETENRARAIQLGQGRNWVFEISISARVKRVITGALMEAEENE